ncbi:methyltransferase-like protein 27 isoform X1 [Littorina saxatilis]|uniref:Methyltransferase type 11 domain-containing protein n=1 Tax=Littorina saxatilis TaxID=31220 RepID=A0AAN9B5W9_9CAEN
MAAMNGDKPKEWTDLEDVAAKMLVPGVTPQQVTDYYNTWAKSGYDVKIAQEFSRPQKILGDQLKELFPKNREKYSVLDVGAGTGITGQHLRQIGFLTIDALEPAPEMLRVAMEKKIYRNDYSCYLTGEPTEIPAASYDAAVLVGVVGHGHLPCAAFEEMARLVKPGGYIVNCMREAYLHEIPEYIQNWEPMIARLEKEGKWKVVKMERYKNHFIGKDGLLTVFHVC